jgi:hypothetical protein
MELQKRVKNTLKKHTLWAIELQTTTFDFNAEIYASHYFIISDLARKHHGQLDNLTATTLDPLEIPLGLSPVFFEEPQSYNCYRFAIRSELWPRNQTLSTAPIYELLALEIAAIKPRISYYFKEDERQGKKNRS